MTAPAWARETPAELTPAEWAAAREATYFEAAWWGDVTAAGHWRL